tara:strand:+ start:21 stop:167 length:147 start_codon:yes stop_codon:yes gene_type:complete
MIKFAYEYQRKYKMKNIQNQFICNNPCPHVYRNAHQADLAQRSLNPAI